MSVLQGGNILRKVYSAALAVIFESVLLCNQVYGASGLGMYVNDTSASEQWALYNDGTFSIEDEKNRYPVYEDPFGDPAKPGEWRQNEETELPIGPGYSNEDSVKDNGTGGGQEGKTGSNPISEQEKKDLLGVLVQVGKIRAEAGIDINLKHAWEKYGNGSHDTIVAMIDTGIDIGHEDLSDAIWVNTGEIPGNGIDDDGNGYIDDVNGWNFYHNNNQVFYGEEDSHGTHSTGTIRAKTGNGLGIAGIIPGNRVRVMPVKALGGENGDGGTAGLIRAIRYAEDNGAVICNLSLTSTANDRALYLAMKNSSMLFVVAAGNGDADTGVGVNIDETPYYPAAYDLDNVISVANLTCDGKLHVSSNYGEKSVDLAAPGSYILSTTPGNTYSYMSGTSMAAPMVTGAAAMVYSYFDGIGVSDVKEILLSTVTPLESLSGKVSSGGLLNVGAALDYDISTLSRSGFQNGGHRPKNGTEPFMEARTRETEEGLVLTLRVVDIDRDLDTLLYAKGNVTKEQFVSGEVGEPFKLRANDTAAFIIKGAGVYNFYAADKNGNGNVYTVKFANMSEGPGALD